MSLITKEHREAFCKRKGIVLRGEEFSPERAAHLEEVRAMIWRDMGYELVNGKWKRLIPLPPKKRIWKKRNKVTGELEITEITYD